MAVTDDQWAEARTYYEAGKSTYEIADLCGFHRKTLTARIQKEDWEDSKKARSISTRIKAVEKIIDDAVVYQKNEPNAEEAFPILLDVMQRRIINTLKKACDSASEFIENHPDGMYLKQESYNGGKTYGLTCEIIAPLAAALASCAEFTKDLPGLTINNNTINQATPIQIEIKGV